MSHLEFPLPTLSSPVARDLPGRPLAAVLLSAAAVLACLQPLPALAQSAEPTEAVPDEGPTRVDDAWFTGPMLANSPNTLPRGHFLVEPYVYDVAVSGSHNIGSLTYILYGLSDQVTVGVKPSFGLISGDPVRRQTSIGMGDLSLQAQYRIRSARSASWSPAVAISLQQSLPTGKYDRLGDRPEAGLGNGSFGTTVALYAQSAGRLANGRTLRARLNLSTTFQSSTAVRGVSVYGTGQDFVGRAKPGGSTHIGVAFEYSVTRNWAFALDGIADRRGATSVSGTSRDQNGAVIFETRRFGSGWSYGIAPGVEYNWTANFGVLFATRFVAAGKTGPASITPAVALNVVF